MKALAQTLKSGSHEWELTSLRRRVPRGVRRARDLSTARRIVATAEQIFAEQGLAGARMDEIARAAKVNKALLYYYFRSKEELYRFVLETLLSQLSAQVPLPADGSLPVVRQTGRDRQAGDAGAATPSAGKRLSAVVDHFFDFVLAHPNYPRLIQREIMGRGPNVGWIVTEYYRPLHGRLVRLIEEGISAGEFRRVDARNAAVTVVSIMVHYFSAAPVLGRVLGHDPLRPQEVAKRREAVQDFLEHGLSLTGKGPGAGAR